jgi:aromatic ring hydroxylase
MTLKEILNGKFTIASVQLTHIHKLRSNVLGLRDMTVTLYHVCTTCLEQRQGKDGCCKAAMRNKSRTLLDHKETNYMVKTVKMTTLVSQPPVMVSHTFIEQAGFHDIIYGHNAIMWPPVYL